MYSKRAVRRHVSPAPTEACPTKPLPIASAIGRQAQSEEEKTEMSKSKNNYTVGRGKPPIINRFQKGESGNPRGRPRRAATTFPDKVAKILAKTKQVNISGLNVSLTYEDLFI